MSSPVTSRGQPVKHEFYVCCPPVRNPANKTKVMIIISIICPQQKLYSQQRMQKKK